MNRQEYGVNSKNCMENSNFSEQQSLEVGLPLWF